jgi:hypothetical protein
VCRFGGGFGAVCLCGSVRGGGVLSGGGGSSPNAPPPPPPNTHTPLSRARARSHPQNLTAVPDALGKRKSPLQISIFDQAEVGQVQKQSGHKAVRCYSTK